MEIHTAMKYIAFLILSFESFAGGFFYEVVPENPLANENIGLFYEGCQPPFPNIATNELFYTVVNGNVINFIGSYTASLPTCPTTTEFTYDLGFQQPGDYVLNIFTVPSFVEFPIDESLLVDPNFTLNFSVGAPAPVLVPTLDSSAIFFLCILILVIFRLKH
ncbi:hypothetical protein [Marinicella sp. W31]|uniref:hypothetical protein n=1 Tax=Marinicella sp. W31 TaxID=3023713 RepID=UPI003758077D